MSPVFYTYTYDRYGNRWAQTVTSGTGYNESLTFNSTNNQVASSGTAYDAAGNMTNDGSYTYSYDAEGRIVTLKTEGGATIETYTYDALGHRVQILQGTANTEFVFNPAGQRVSVWNGATGGGQYQGNYYWGSKPVGFYAGGTTYFQHQDWEGTERLRTTYNGGVEGSFTSLPFGDGLTTTGTDNEANHYAMLDHDYQSDTEHAQFRQYNSAQGHWLSPDPYSGSYDLSNPQSFNRYVYALNNPLSAMDPSGLALTFVCTTTDTNFDPGDGGAGVNSTTTCTYYDDGIGDQPPGYNVPSIPIMPLTHIPTAPNNGDQTQTYTPKQQHDAVCKQAQNLNRQLAGARLASTVVGAAGGACIAATAGGCAPVGTIGLATGIFGNLVFGGAELINGAIANIGLECNISY